MTHTLNNIPCEGDCIPIQFTLLLRCWIITTVQFMWATNPTQSWGPFNLCPVEFIYDFFPSLTYTRFNFIHKPQKQPFIIKSDFLWMVTITSQMKQEYMLKNTWAIGLFIYTEICEWKEERANHLRLKRWPTFSPLVTVLLLLPMTYNE